MNRILSRLAFAVSTASLLLALAAPTASLAQGPAPVRPTPPGVRPRPGAAGAAGAANPAGRPGRPGRPGSNAPAAAAAGSGAGTVIATDSDDPNSLNYVEAALDIVLQDYAQRTKRIVIKAPNLPTPTITLQSIPGVQITDEEYLGAIERILAVNGVVLEPEGDTFLRVLPSAEASKYGSKTVFPEYDEEGKEITPPLPEYVGYASRLVQLKHIDIEEAKPILDGFTRQGAQIQTFERTNQVRITDATENINRLLEILDTIDKPLPDPSEVLNVVKILYAKAADVKARLEEIVASQQEEAQQNANKKKSVPVNNASGPPGTSARPLPAGTVTPNRRPAAPPAAPANSSFESLVQDAERGLIRGSVQIVADERINTLIILTRPENMAFFEKVIKVLDVETAPDVLVEVVRLEHAVAKDVATLINDFISNDSSSKNDESVRPGASGETGKSESLSEAAASKRSDHAAAKSATAAGGATMVGKLDKENIKILADERSNALLVMATAADMPAVLNLIKRVDIQLSQVVIETVMVEVSFSDGDESGVDWVQRALNVVNERGGEAKWTFAASGGGGSGTPIPANTLTGVSSFSGTSGINGWFTIHNLNLDLVVKFIQTDSQSRLMDSPRITTMDNKEAVLESTQRIYWSEGSTRSYSSSSDYYTDNIKNEDVGIKITLTPRINNKGYVILTVEEEQQAVNGYTTLTTSGRDNQFPNLTTRKMGADVAVQSGDTIVLGGLAENSTSRTRKKIPFLGDIPLLGRLFSSDKEERRRTELLVFITPYVLDTPAQIENDTRNAKASMDTGTIFDSTWSRSRVADPVPEKAHKHVLENGRHTVLPPRYPLSGALSDLNEEYGLTPEAVEPANGAEPEAKAAEPSAGEAQTAEPAETAPAPAEGWAW